MANDERITIDGKPSKPWQLWRVHDGQQISKIAEATSREELPQRRRDDWQYEIYHNRRPHGRLAYSVSQKVT